MLMGGEGFNKNYPPDAIDYVLMLVDWIWIVFLLTIIADEVTQLWTLGPQEYLATFWNVVEAIPRPLHS